MAVLWVAQERVMLIKFVRDQYYIFVVKHNYRVKKSQALRAVVAGFKEIRAHAFLIVFRSSDSSYQPCARD